MHYGRCYPHIIDLNVSYVTHRLVMSIRLIATQRHSSMLVVTFIEGITGCPCKITVFLDFIFCGREACPLMEIQCSPHILPDH